MDHIHFKANQTAAAYVANELDERAQEAFELHMMNCTDCTGDVEAWRVIKRHMPASVTQTQFRKPWWGGWGMAASLVGAIAVSGLTGWYASALQRPSLDSSETAVFNMPALTRGAGDCTVLPLAANTRAVVLRVPGVPSDRQLVATGMTGGELAGDSYSSREQRDGSWVVRFEAKSLQQAPAQLVIRKADGADEALGCFTAAVSPPPG